MLSPPQSCLTDATPRLRSCRSCVCLWECELCRYSVVSVIFTRMFDTQCQADTSMSRHCDTVTLQSPLAVLSCRLCVVRAWCARGARVVRACELRTRQWCAVTQWVRRYPALEALPHPAGFVTQVRYAVRYASSLRKFIPQVRYASSLRRFVTPVPVPFALL